IQRQNEVEEEALLHVPTDAVRFCPSCERQGAARTNQTTLPSVCIRRREPREDSKALALSLLGVLRVSAKWLSGRCRPDPGEGPPPRAQTAAYTGTNVSVSGSPSHRSAASEPKNRSRPASPCRLLPPPLEKTVVSLRAGLRPVP